jgi:hypothetical protein
LCDDPEDRDVTFTYAPGVGKLLVDVLLKFDFDTTTQAWDVAVVSSSAIASAVAPNIPGESIIQKEDPGCFTSNVSDATATAVDSIDFASAISALIGPLLHSIPASGQLTPDIRYEFALGDSQLSFPGDQGIAVGVTGRVSYRGAYYPGTPPAALPVPPVPTAADTHHLQIYVSSYEWNALHWAFSQAGLLDVTVRPDDLPDPDVLKVKTYEVAIAAFKPYAPFAMTATVKPKRAPVASLREVYEFTQPVMQLLQQQLPTNIYQQIGGLDGNAYASREDLEADLSEAGVPPADSGIIEKAARSMGMAVTQDLEFTLTIENNAAPAPNLVFDVARTDILQGLALGVSGGGAQTLQYGFKPATGKTAATFVSTTVPHFDGGAFGAMIWPIVGEPNYDKLLADMGKTGVPLPIMQDFQFLFEQAQVSIQQDYVSVLAQVAFKGTSAA